MYEILGIALLMLAICLPVIVIVFIKYYLNYKKQVAVEIAKMNQEIELQNTEELAAQVMQLQQRMEALESIVTNKGYELNEKISSL